MKEKFYRLYLCYFLHYRSKSTNKESFQMALVLMVVISVFFLLISYYFIKHILLSIPHNFVGKMDNKDQVLLILCFFFYLVYKFYKYILINKLEIDPDNGISDLYNYTPTKRHIKNSMLFYWMIILIPVIVFSIKKILLP